MPAFAVSSPLDPGDRVAVVSPSSALAAAYPDVYELGLSRLGDLGVEPVEYPTATADDEYLRDNPDVRARDVERAFRDPDIGAVVSTIGGNDQIRLLRHLDVDVLRDHPTRFLGSSDSTVLHAALWSVGVVSCYGGHLMTDFAGPDGIPDYSREHLERTLYGELALELRPAPAFADDTPDWAQPSYIDIEREWEPNPGWEWRGAEERTKGRTWGGCLEVLDLLLAADQFAPGPDEDLVICLETSEELPEEPYVRRMLLGLGERGLFDRASAVLVGRPSARSHRQDRPPDERREYRRQQYDAVAETVAEYNPAASVVCGLDFGHTAPTPVPPLGVQATVDPGAGMVSIG